MGVEVSTSVGIEFSTGCHQKLPHTNRPQSVKDAVSFKNQVDRDFIFISVSYK